jgi:hypothetical protein
LRHDYREDETIVRARFSRGLSAVINFPVDDRPYAEYLHGDSLVSPADFSASGKYHQIYIKDWKEKNLEEIIPPF